METAYSGLRNIITVIDDDAVTRTMVETILKKSGFTVFSAGDGESGFEIVREKKPDVVICDLVLPKKDGIELCREIKATPDLGWTKIILMTAVYRGSSSRGMVEEAGADEFIEKPIETATLMKKVYKLLQQIVETMIEQER